ncbi:SAM-dependent methyltransferase [Nonomuraea sp. NBC_01738]|uniref:SAM-dependent methyltransferase n=1 Tax=Nonomuraea sp. NBC_01738 TaxID=2976003 RepID=UPI002E14769F|nr:SAM-dependent methyltransferase [Nonomuraea sp. NBC_01738]
MRQRAIRNLANLVTEKATPTRVLDAAAGGKNNFVADRNAVSRYDRAAAVSTTAARAVMRFLARVVRTLAAEGVDQFVVIGSGVPSGLPAGRQLHDVARADPGSGWARVVYVESDPMILANAYATIEPISDLVRVVEGDMWQVDEVLADRVLTTFIDWERPVGLLLVSAHSITDDEHFTYVIKRLGQAASPGSYLAVLQATLDGIPDELLPAIHDLLAVTLPGYATRSRADLTAAMSGLDLLEPGLTWVSQWRPDGHDSIDADCPESSGNYGAVASLN